MSRIGPKWGYRCSFKDTPASKSYGLRTDEIDRTPGLSREGKYRERSKIADVAIADFEASKTLARAREAIEFATAKLNLDQHSSPEIAHDSEVMLNAMKEVEWGWQRAMEKIAERASLTKSSAIRR